MTTITLDEMQQNLLSYVQRVQAGETLLIVDANQPVAEIKPITRLTKPRPIGLAQGEFVVPDDFNAPLPNEVLRDFEDQSAISALNLPYLFCAIKYN